MCDTGGDHGDETDVVGFYRSLASANHCVLTHLQEEYGDGVEWEEYEEDTSGLTASVAAAGFEGETFKIYVLVREVLP